MNPPLIEQLASMVRQYGLDEVVYSNAEWCVRLVAQPRPKPGTSAGPQPETVTPLESASFVQQSPEADKSSSRIIELKVQMTGIFYTTPAPDDPPFVSIGTKVTAGQTIALIEAMKMMAPFETDQTGTIVKIHKVSGDTVQRGDVLFSLSLGA